MSVIVFDIGGTKIAYGIVTEKYEVQNFNIIATKNVYSNILNFVINVIYDLSSENADLKGIAIGIPGTIDYQSNKIISCPNLKVLNDINLSELIYQKTGFPTLVSRDVNFSILAEHTLGAVKDLRNVLGIFIGTGLGASLLINGRIFLGSHGVASELGHIYYPKGQKEICECGNIDCVELYASGKSLEKRAKMFKEKFNKNLSQDNYFTFFDENWKKEIDSFIEALSFSISTFVNIIDPEVVLIGGGVSQANGFPWAEILKKTMQKIRKPLPYERIKFRKAELTYQENLIGGYVYFKDVLFNQIEGK